MIRAFLLAVTAFLCALAACPVTAQGYRDTNLGAPSGTAAFAVARPSIPSRRFNIREFGAKGDGVTLDTDALERAIRACAEAGGGTVVLPPGRYLTRPFNLTSSLNLHLETGATLLFTTDPADYSLPGGRDRRCISAEGCHDVAVTGAGTIDGQGGAWWPRYVKSYVPPPGSPPLPHRPYMVTFGHCSRVLVEGVTLTNSPMFHLVPTQCRDVTIRRVHILAPASSPNTDGIDPSGWNFLITDCTLDVGDDNIALKPNPQKKGEPPSCQNFLITHCRFLHGHGMSIGSQTAGGVENMIVRDCTFDGTNAGIRLKAARDRGGLVENLTYERLKMTRVKTAILLESYYPKLPKDITADPAQPLSATTPFWRHIRIRDVTARESREAGLIVGLPESPVSDVVLTNVRISAERGLRVFHATTIRFVRSRIEARKGAALTTEHADVQGLDGPVSSVRP